MPVTKEEVLWGYRMILGREPESENAVINHMKCENRQGLRDRLLQAPKFASKQPGVAKPLFSSLPLTVPRLEVDTNASEAQLRDCIAKISAAWNHLGSVKPHYSVLTAKEFLPENLDGSIDNFWATGEREASTLELILARHGCRQLSTMTCVEYGCGVGRITMNLARRFARVHAYDISPAHLSLARQRAEEVGAGNVEFHLCSDNLLEPLQECDVFYSLIVFQHNPPPLMKVLIQNALHALKPGGIAVFQTPTYQAGYHFKTDEWLGIDNTVNMEMHCLPQQTIFEVIAEEGCVPLEIREYDHTGASHMIISNVFVIQKKTSILPTNPVDLPNRIINSDSWKLLSWLPALLTEVIQSDEFWEKTVAARSADLVRALFVGMLGADPGQTRMIKHIEKLQTTKDLPRVIADICDSDELIQSKANTRRWPNPGDTFEEPCLIFLHAMKTAGTSVVNHLLDSFGKKVYRDVGNSLHLYSQAALSKYCIFCGHFNYDSIRYIPKGNLSIFTFVREPKSRVLSYYYFAYAHNPSSPNYNWEMRLANELPTESFFEDERVRSNPAVLDHMCWAIMGMRQWEQWHSIVQGITETEFAEISAGLIRPAVRRRLTEFMFVGLQEDFDRSVDMLFRMIGKEPPDHKREDNVLAKRIQNHPHLKKNLEKAPVTPALDAALDRLVRLDNIVYEEARKLYSDRLAKIEGQNISGLGRSLNFANHFPVNEEGLSA